MWVAQNEETAAHRRDPTWLKKFMEDCLLGEGYHIAAQEDCEELSCRAGRWQKQHGIDEDWLQPPFPAFLKAVPGKKRGGGKMVLWSNCISYCPVLIQMVEFLSFKWNQYCFPKSSLLPMTIIGDSAHPVLCLKPLFFPPPRFPTAGEDEWAGYVVLCSHLCRLKPQEHHKWLFSLDSTSSHWDTSNVGGCPSVTETIPNVNLDGHYFYPSLIYVTCFQIALVQATLHRIIT